LLFPYVRHLASEALSAVLNSKARKKYVDQCFRRHVALLRCNLEKAVRVRQVTTRVHAQCVEVMLKMITFQTRSKPVDKKLEKLCGAGYLPLWFHFQKQVAHHLPAKSEYHPTEVLVWGWHLYDSPTPGP